MGFINELTIIIVLFEEKKELLFKCLHNIKNFKVIIIDNAGNSELRDQVQEEFVIQHYILNKKNYGFTKAANQAIKLCNTDYILNINADCFIQAQDILLLVKAHQSYDNCFIAAPTFYNDNHELTDNSDCFHEKNLNREILNLEGDVCVDIVLGAAILFKKKDMIALGLLDENYFLYFIDYDLCRMIKQKNKSVIQVFNAKAQHSHGQSKVKNAFKRTFLRSYHFTYDEMCYYYKINEHHEKYKNLKKKIPSYIVKTIFNFIIFRINKSINFFSMIKAFYDFNRLIKK